ncbi:glycosyltransferase [Synechococcus sp. CCY9202]|uniref:glycosyltransferase n=1 Tax=Synechococcus sp. CCY9202 TaxID=174698 RepID=UPI002B2186BA|nr:glycosyltransferase [Synechococcus sp. CCY9202]MEA5423972.1 glycosyltransferase [Synechococcus sp. CCY9202]
MELLLIHQNYPGQFRYLAPALGRLGHNVSALGASPAKPAQRASHLQYPWSTPSLPADLVDPALETSLLRGERVAEHCLRLRDQGYVPAAILVHSGWGEALYLRDVWPRARLLIYPELYASPRLLGYGFDADLGTPPFALQGQWRRRNLMNLAAIADADAAVVPTLFQRDTFPPHLRSRFHVIHEGVDLDQLRPNPACRLQIRSGLVLRRGDPVITFTSRYLEPLRGFRTFMRCLPALMASHPTLQVLVVGSTASGYGAVSAHPQGYKGEMLALLGDQLPLDRLHFLGRLSLEELHSLFQITAAHVHLTYPYALSWSLIEAMACGALIVGSDNAPLNEVLHHGHNGLLVPFNDPEALGSWLSAILRQPEAFAPMAREARRTVETRYNLSAAAAAYDTLLRSLVALPSDQA